MVISEQGDELFYGQAGLLDDGVEGGAFQRLASVHRHRHVPDRRARVPHDVMAAIHTGELKASTGESTYDLPSCTDRQSSHSLRSNREVFDFRLDVFRNSPAFVAIHFEDGFDRLPSVRKRILSGLTFCHNLRQRRDKHGVTTLRLWMQIDRKLKLPLHQPNPDEEPSPTLTDRRQRLNQGSPSYG